MSLTLGEGRGKYYFVQYKQVDSGGYTERELCAPRGETGNFPSGHGKLGSVLIAIITLE